MTKQAAPNVLTRREWMIRTTAVTGGVLLGSMAGPLRWISLEGWQGGQAAASQDALAARRAQMGAVPITATELGPTLVMLSGPGGNVVVQRGQDGLVVVDTFVQPAWPALQNTLAGLGKSVRAAIDTHWHFDHSDNNASLRQAGAALIAHTNTARRLTERHEILGMRIEPSPAAALPTQTFSQSTTLVANGETIELGAFAPAHTDTDIYIRFPRANVLHLGDTYFNGGYPFFDLVTGGRIGGMIQAADRALGLVDANTKVVPGHGPLGNRESLVRYRDMMVTVRDRVQKLKAGGRPVAEVVKAQPTKDLDAAWGKGFLTPDMFVTLVYQTL